MQLMQIVEHGVFFVPVLHFSCLVNYSAVL
jgi:hypothetical protein